MPLFQTFPSLGQHELRDQPALVLYNAIALGPSGPPLEYIEQAVPMAQAKGTQFFRPFSVLEVLEGSYDFHIIFITEWKNRGALISFHHSPQWLEIVPTRNSHFTNLVEAISAF